MASTISSSMSILVTHITSISGRKEDDGDETNKVKHSKQTNKVVELIMMMTRVCVFSFLRNGWNEKGLTAAACSLSCHSFLVSIFRKNDFSFFNRQNHGKGGEASEKSRNGAFCPTWRSFILQIEFDGATDTRSLPVVCPFVKLFIARWNEIGAGERWTFLAITYHSHLFGPKPDRAGARRSVGAASGITSSGCQMNDVNASSMRNS